MFLAIVCIISKIELFASLKGVDQFNSISFNIYYQGKNHLNSRDA